ncbi:MAG: DnaJ C-terminal domain-containing protein [Woeseiaceae bacterium]
MEYKDYYKVMGVERDASEDDIKRAYRRLARKYHPDVSKETDAEARFKEVGEAYAVLRDPEKRAAYDQLGQNWKQGQDFRPPPDWDAGFEHSGGGFEGAESQAFSDFFESLFGGGGFRAGTARGTRGGFQARGEDHHAKVLIDLADTYTGATRNITLSTPTVDREGHVSTTQRSLNVKIPKGIRQGQRIRLAGQGAPGIGGGPTGDLYLEIEFRPHNLFRVDGQDVYLDLPLTPWEAALGAKVKVPTPGGTVVDLTIPKGSGNGRQLRVKGHGIPGSAPGDLYVVPQVTLPPADSPKARALFEKMAEDLPYNPRSKLGV